MTNTSNYIEAVGQIVEKLEGLGLTPVLVGGMALVILGSRRVTQDFDILVADNKELRGKVIEIFYTRGFELVSKMDSRGDILSTIDNQKIASFRLHADSPSSVHFFNRRTGLRIDLLFDFPLPAHELAARSQKKKVRSYTFCVASKKDLIRLKEIAYKDRSLATDAQDLEFLKKK